MPNLKGAGKSGAVLATAVMMTLQCGAANADELGPAGGESGSPQASQCIQDYIVIGVKLRVGSWIDRVEAVCAVFTNGVRGGSTLGGSSLNGGYIGGPGGQPFELICCGNKAGGDEGPRRLVLRLAFDCLRVSQHRRDDQVRNQDLDGGPGGKGGSSFGPLICLGRPVKQLVGKGSSWVDSLSMICG